VALDGLRGVAAFVVVVHHGLLTWPALAAQYWAPNRASGTWWLTFTPLHLAWAGTEAVVLFFVLSGIVLTLPYVGRRGPGTWGGYYARRLIRLYVPVAVALVLAAVLVKTFPRTPEPGVSWWFAIHDVAVTPAMLLHDGLLLDGVSWVNAVLWSLRFEVVFSLLLPVVVLVVRRLPARLWVSLPAALALVAVGRLSASPFAQWLPIFIVGVVLAAGYDEMRLLGTRINSGPWRRTLWGGLGILAAGLLLAEWWFRAFSVTPVLWNVVAPPLVALGAAVLCFLALACPGVRSVCSGRTLQWAGRVSFSLYLVHEPILVSVSTIVGPSVSGVALTVLVGGALGIGVATAFYRFVEQPAQRWARTMGRRVDRRAATAVAAPAHG
jgi:peptidoglycan/LPS O-acetylase OafA/YrhL